MLTVESGEGEKSRAFRGMLLGYVKANQLWDKGRTDSKTVRPVWAMLAASPGEAGAFFANLRMGRKAGHTDGSYEWLKTASYIYAQQRTAAGVITTIFLPDLFRIDPGMVNAQDVSFVCLPSQEWVAEERTRLGQTRLVSLVKGEEEDDEPEERVTYSGSDSYLAIMEHIRSIFEPQYFGIYENAYQRRNDPGYKTPTAQLDDVVNELLPFAPLFCAYLDRRTHCPIVPDIRFQVQLFLTALHNHIVVMDSNVSFATNQKHKLKFSSSVDERLGLAPPMACYSGHEIIEEMLSAEVERYFKFTKRPAKMPSKARKSV